MEYQSTSTPDGLAPKQTIHSPQGTTTVPQGIKQDPIPLELCEICIHGVEVCYTPILPMNFFPKECIFCENFYHPAEITFFLFFAINLFKIQKLQLFLLFQSFVHLRVS